MNLSFDRSAPEYSAVAAMVEGQRGQLPPLEIAEHDRKYAHARETSGRTTGLMSYFRAGMQTSDAIQQLLTWHFGADRKISRFLDFASGFGRSTRFLVEDLGPDRVWAGDIDPEALEFQRQQFAIQTIQSTARPENFKPGLQFDCIFAGSLFCHLPELSFTRWLWKLHSVLAPGGLLIFSVNGESSVPAGLTMPRNGFHFTPKSDRPSPELTEYGDSIVLEHFVQNAVQAVTGLPHQRRIAQALSFSQDVYVIAKGKLKHGEIPFKFGPIGCVDFGRWSEPESLKLSGWAFDVNRDERIEEVQVTYNGVLRGTCEVTNYRPDVAAVLGCSNQAEAVRSGWECCLDLTGERIDPENDWVTVKAISTSGRQFVLLLEHPANLREFDAPQGWTHSESGNAAEPITAALRYIYLPHNGRFTSSDPSLSGWIATKDKAALEGVRLEGRFGEIPFTAMDRPDVVEALPGLSALGFDAILPLKYLTVADPQLRFVTARGTVLAALETRVETGARVPEAASELPLETSVG